MQAFVSLLNILTSVRIKGMGVRWLRWGKLGNVNMQLSSSALEPVTMQRYILGSGWYRDMKRLLVAITSKSISFDPSPWFLFVLTCARHATRGSARGLRNGARCCSCSWIMHLCPLVSRRILDFAEILVSRFFVRHVKSHLKKVELGFYVVFMWLKISWRVKQSFKRASYSVLTYMAITLSFF